MKNRILLFFSILSFLGVQLFSQGCLPRENERTKSFGKLYGISRIADICSLPLLDKGVCVKYEGSIDKKGGNADWDWYLYQDKYNDWVIFDVSGPGCIYNFVQHRYLSSEDPVFRFYIDGEESPRFVIRLSEFGEKFPFVEPLASCYIGPVDNDRGPIRVARSFVPFAFRESCRITSNIKLEGAERLKGQGGWGHIIYHSYTSADGIESFTGKENYESLIQMWKRKGTDPKPLDNNKSVRLREQSLSPGSLIKLIDFSGSGSIAALRLYISDMVPARLNDVWVHMAWDNHEKPDVSCPIGCLFGNSLGYNDTNYLLMGASTDGWFYNYFPMPFWEHASISVENRSSENIMLGFSEVAYCDSVYERSNCGYFRSSSYYDRKHTPNADSKIGVIRGAGKMVAAHVTCYGEKPNIITCEGDVRVYIDGNKTPQVESDGSESYVCYGWGFPTPAETHPSGGYDGLNDNPWSMTRLCIGDSYPFGSELCFGIESGENNNQYLEHSGILYYYGKDTCSLVKTDSLDLSSSLSVNQHRYQAHGNVVRTMTDSYFEGDEDHVLIKGISCIFTEFSSFKIAIIPDNEGVKLRRRSNQCLPRQCAKVFVDGTEVTERQWYTADSNSYKCWLEDEFEIPAHLTTGKSSLQVRIEPVQINTLTSWNESFYQVFCHILSDK